MYQLTTDVYFDSAHFLSAYYGKCENLHGHRWRATISIAADALQEAGTMRGMVVDFGVFKKAARALAEEFDHTFLVEEGSLAPATLAALESEGFSLKLLPYRTTAENLARDFCERLRAEGFPVCRVDMYETPFNCATYLPEGPIEGLRAAEPVTPEEIAAAMTEAAR